MRNGSAIVPKKWIGRIILLGCRWIENESMPAMVRLFRVVYEPQPQAQAQVYPSAVR